MTRRSWTAAALVLAVAVALSATWGVVTGCGGGPAAATTIESNSPSPPPGWLLKVAQQRASEQGDSHPDVAYWGLLRDPELGDLTSSGPDDPSHQAYALVLVGDFEDAPMDRSQIGVSPSPLPPITWVCFIYSLEHEDAGIFGYGRGDFMASQYPSLQPFHL
jgi:hypothetical protein